MPPSEANVEGHPPSEAGVKEEEEAGEEDKDGWGQENDGRDEGGETGGSGMPGEKRARCRAAGDVFCERDG